MKNKKPRRPSLLVPISRRGDSECPECFGYPYHRNYCRKIQDN